MSPRRYAGKGIATIAVPRGRPSVPLPKPDDATLLPDPKASLQARFSFAQTGNMNTYQTDYLLDSVTIARSRKAGSVGLK